KWQKKWEEAKAFEAEPDGKRKKFFITVPYPYVSGPLHIGHGRSFTCGDIFARFKRLKGFNVLFPIAFHITGTPVLAISKSIQAKDEKVLKLMREYVSYHTAEKEKIEGIAESFAEPINIYKYFSKTMKADFSSLGMSFDWRRDFATADRIYNKFIEWQYFKFREKNFLVQGKYPITYCLSDKNAAGEDDIKDGDTDPVSMNEFVFMKFKFGNDYIIAGTLRPETIFGQTNLWVNPDTVYARVSVDGETWIVSKECAEKLSYQREKVKISGEIKGSELVGKICEAPKINRKLAILPAYFCDPDIGSGIVTSVPSDAPYDYIALQELKNDKIFCERFGLDWEAIKKIEPILIIETADYGNFAAKKAVEELGIKNLKDEKLEEATRRVYKAGFHTGTMGKASGKYAGMPAQEAKALIREELAREGKASIFYETTRKAVCRCGGKIIIAKIEGQWFLNYNANGWKENAFACLNKMKICPEKYRQAFEDNFRWLDKRPCARRRGLGTELPFEKGWIIESLSDSTIYMAFYTIAHIIKESRIKPEQLLPEVFDFALLGKGSAASVSKKSGISARVLEKMRESFDYWYPLDQRHTAIMHISNHLSFFIFHHAAIFAEEKWPKAITLIEPVTVEGSKMGKSKGNVIPLAKISSEFGADLFRLYIAYSAEFGTSMDWKRAEAENTRKHLDKFYSLASDAAKTKGKTAAKLSAHSRALLSRVEKRLIEADKLMESCDQRKYVQVVFYDMLNDVLQYAKTASKDERDKALPEIFAKWIIALSPVTPHICEELWEKIGGSGFASLAKWPEPDEKLIDEKAEKAEELVRQTLEDAKEIRKIVKIEAERINIYVSPEWKHEVYSIALKKPENIAREIMKIGAIKKRGNAAVKYAQSLAAKQLAEKLSRKDEFAALKDAEEFFSKETGVPVKIMKAEESKSEKAQRAEPGKPGIEII
ncbi:MAG: leucine--tRNA ligase, partial [Nanoarchaeota archaeon]|nr:leucine--tRNA ligase [Nanoarchaeota archaeon]